MIQSKLILIMLLTPFVVYGQQKDCNSIPRRSIPCNVQITHTFNDTTITILENGCDYPRYGSSANGMWKVFLADSTLFEISSLKNGKRNGVTITYYKNGQIKSQSTYIDDLLHGNYVSYYENGKVNGKGNWIVNRKGIELFTGTWSEYWDNGNIAHFYSQKASSWYDPNEKFWNQKGMTIDKKEFERMWNCR